MLSMHQCKLPARRGSCIIYVVKQLLIMKPVVGSVNVIKLSDYVSELGSDDTFLTEIVEEQHSTMYRFFK